MGIIQGFYQLRTKTNPNYMLYYTGSGKPVMRTTGYDDQNRSIWFLYQISDTETSQVMIVSAMGAVFKNFSSSTPLIETYHVYQQQNKDDMELYIVGNSLSSSSILSKFTMTKTGTTTWGGATRTTVTFQNTNNSKYIVYGDALSDSNASPNLDASGGADYREFILESITPYYGDLVAPTNLNLQASLNDEVTYTNRWRTDVNNFYWSWIDSQNTINADDPHTYRERTYTVNNSGNTTYSDWSSWTGLTSTDCKTEGTRRWMKKTTSVPAVSTTVKAAGNEIQMITCRSVTALGSTWKFQSSTGSRSCKFAKKPTLTKDGLSWTPEGMKVNFTSDYFGQGTLKITFTDVETSSGGILSKNYTAQIVKDSTVTIPQSYFARVPKDGEQVTLSILLNTDVYAPYNYTVSIVDTLTYDEGTVDVTPTITELDGLRYKAVVSYKDTVKMWLCVDGVNTELQGTVSGNTTVFEIIPPFGGKEYGLFTSYENSDKTVWGTDYTEMSAISLRAHAFTWDGGSVFIWLNKDEALQESFTFSPQSTTHTLSGRSHDVVTYLSDGAGEKNYTSVTGDIKGYIVPQIETYGTTRDSIEKLVEQGHVLYRAPYGRVCNVAVTGADITTDVGITEVSISIVQEDDD